MDTNCFPLKNNRRLSVANLKSNFYYRIFIDMKFEKALYEMKWSKMFIISEKESWNSTYIDPKYCNCMKNAMQSLIRARINAGAL